MLIGGTPAQKTLLVCKRHTLGATEDAPCPATDSCTGCLVTLAALLNGSETRQLNNCCIQQRNAASGHACWRALAFR